MDVLIYALCNALTDERKKQIVLMLLGAMPYLGTTTVDETILG